MECQTPECAKVVVKDLTRSFVGHQRVYRLVSSDVLWYGNPRVSEQKISFVNAKR